MAYIENRETLTTTIHIRLHEEQRSWLKKEAEKWEVSEAQIIRGLINSKLSKYEKK